MKKIIVRIGGAFVDWEPFEHEHHGEASGHASHQKCSPPNKVKYESMYYISCQKYAL